MSFAYPQTGEEKKKRNLVMRDRSGGSIDITMWGQQATDPGDELFNLHRSGEKPVVAIKGCRVGDFNGKNLSTIISSSIKIKPNIPEAVALSDWYLSGGAMEQVNALSKMGSGGAGPSGGGGGRRATLSCIKEEGLGQGEKVRSSNPHTLTL